MLLLCFRVCYFSVTEVVPSSSLFPSSFLACLNHSMSISPTFCNYPLNTTKNCTYSRHQTTETDAFQHTNNAALSQKPNIIRLYHAEEELMEFQETIHMKTFICL
jgi:hypothetical protein